MKQCIYNFACLSETIYVHVQPIAIVDSKLLLYPKLTNSSGNFNINLVHVLCLLTLPMIHGASMHVN